MQIYYKQLKNLLKENLQYIYYKEISTQPEWLMHGMQCNDSLLGSMGFCRYFVEILQETSDMNEIQFHEDGTWSPLKTSKEHHVISCSPAAHKSSHKESRSSSSSSTSGTLSGFTVSFIMRVL